jgi:4'-phosphopantetheinyl transferase
MMSSVVNGRGIPSPQLCPAVAAVVEVWSVFVDDEEAASRCLALMPPDECERLSALVPPHRHRHTCAHAAARILASAALGAESSMRVLIRTPEGRLALAASAAPSDAPFDLSLAHSGEYAAIAFSRCGAVGVDIEALSPLSESEERRLAGFSLAESEYAQWCQAAPALRSQLLTRAWTRKEAVLKALGLGLAGDVRAVATRLRSAEAEAATEGDAAVGPVRIHGLPDVAGESSNWTLRDLPDEPGLIGSVAVKAAYAKVHYHRCGIQYLLGA